jgi:hypothetical protein
MKKCRSCGAKIPDGKNHYCPKEKRTIDSDDGDFLLSFIVGRESDSTLLGTALGGDFLGALLGDLSNDSDSDDD